MKVSKNSGALGLWILMSMGSICGAQDFFKYNLEIIKLEHDVVQKCVSCVTDLKKAYQKKLKEAPNFAVQTQKRLKALEWVGTDLSAEALESKLNEASKGRLSVAPTDEDFYEKSRVIGLLSEAEIRKSKTKTKPVLMYYVNGRSDFHFSAEGKERLQDFINLTGLPKGTDVKRVEAAKEILASIKSLNL